MSPNLFAILVCPIAKCRLEFDSLTQELISRPLKLAYPIQKGIPILLESEARRWESV